MSERIDPRETFLRDADDCTECGGIMLDGVCTSCGYDWHDEDDEWYDDEHDQFMSDAEADADVLRMAGWGTDEDYGYYGYGEEY